MQSAVRRRLEQTIDYHHELSEHHRNLHEENNKPMKGDKGPATGQKAGTELKSEEQQMDTDQTNRRVPRYAKDEKVVEEKQQEQTEQQPEEPQSPDDYLAKMHADVVQQLREVLDMHPMQPAIRQAREQRPVTRAVN